MNRALACFQAAALAAVAFGFVNLALAVAGALVRWLEAP